MGSRTVSRDRNSGFGRRRFLKGAAACGGGLLLGARGAAFAATDGSLIHSGSLFNLCAGPDGRIYASSTRPDGHSALEVFGRGQKFDGQSLSHLAEMAKTGTKPLALNYPQGLCFDAEGSLFVVDSNNGRIQVLETTQSKSSPFKYKREFARLGPKAGECHTPQGIAWHKGQIYLADTRNHRIQIFDALSGKVLLVVGERGTGSGQLRLPADVAIDADGTIYVADSGNGRIQVFSAAMGSQGAKVRRILAEKFTFPLSALVVLGENVLLLESPAAIGRRARLHVIPKSSEKWSPKQRPSHPIEVAFEKLQVGVGEANALVQHPYGLCVDRAGALFVGDRVGCRVAVLDVSSI